MSKEERADIDAGATPWDVNRIDEIYGRAHTYDVKYQAKKKFMTYELVKPFYKISGIHRKLALYPEGDYYAPEKIEDIYGRMMLAENSYDAYNALKDLLRELDDPDNYGVLLLNPIVRAPA